MFENNIYMWHNIIKETNKGEINRKKESWDWCVTLDWLSITIIIRIESGRCLQRIGMLDSRTIAIDVVESVSKKSLISVIIPFLTNKIINRVHAYTHMGSRKEIAEKMLVSRV